MFQYDLCSQLNQNIFVVSTFIEYDFVTTDFMKIRI